MFARCLSSLKDERVIASKQLKGPLITFKGDKAKFVKDLKQVQLKFEAAILKQFVFHSLVVIFAYIAPSLLQESAFLTSLVCLSMLWLVCVPRK